MAKTMLPERLLKALKKIIPEADLDKWVHPEDTNDNPNESWINIPIPIQDRDDKRFLITVMFNKEEITSVSIYTQKREWDGGIRIADARKEEV